MYIAGREKDRRYTSAAARHGLAKYVTLVERLSETEVPEDVREHVGQLIAVDFASLQGP
jgi:hypothetical protein